MRYLPPVYSPITCRAFCAAALTTSTDRAGRRIDEAKSAVSQRFPGFDVYLTDSGTSALTVALQVALARQSCKVASAPLVAVPAYACPDIATAVLGANARLVAYDTDPATLEPDWDSVRAALSVGAQVLVVAHLYGRVVDLAPARDLASEYGALVVEDAAQHAGGAVHGVRGGSQATLGVLSFGRGKGINAGGGGALLCRTADRWRLPDLAEAPADGAALARAVASDLLANPWLFRAPARVPVLGVGDTTYHPPRTVKGMPPRMVSLLLAALRGEATELADRRARERALLDAIEKESLPGVQLPTRAPEGGALRAPILLAPWFVATRPILPALGVVRSYPRTLLEYGEFHQHIVHSGRMLPGARRLAAETYTAPTHCHVRHKDLLAIASMLGAA